MLPLSLIVIYPMFKKIFAVRSYFYAYYLTSWNKTFSRYFLQFFFFFFKSKDQII